MTVTLGKHCTTGPLEVSYRYRNFTVVYHMHYHLSIAKTYLENLALQDCLLSHYLISKTILTHVALCYSGVLVV